MKLSGIIKPADQVRDFYLKNMIIFYYIKNQINIHTIYKKKKDIPKRKVEKPVVIDYGSGFAEFFEDEIGVYNLTNLSDVWDISYINSQAKERIGYPTQKPLELLERIITIYTKKGDIVADFFCGSGTTLVAAQKLGRHWMGCDINPKCETIVKQRLLMHS